MSNKYLDFTGLSTYDQKIKEYIRNEDDAVEEQVTDLKSEITPSLSDRINLIHNMIDYGYADEDVQGNPETSTLKNRISISRRNTQVVVNLPSSSGKISVKITGDIKRGATNADVDAWATGLSLVEGHKYRAIMALISGTVTASDTMPALLAIKVGAHDTASVPNSSSERDGTSYYRYFTAPSEQINLIMVFYGGTVATNAVYQVVLEDITSETDGKSLRSKIGDISGEINYTTITPDMSKTTVGLTISTDENGLVIYGISTGTRYVGFLNGNNFAKGANDPFVKTINAGTYLVDFQMTGARPRASIRGSYTTFDDNFTVISTIDDQPHSKQYTFAEDTMLGILLGGNNVDYGTIDNPTRVRFRVYNATANDATARSQNKAISAELKNATKDIYAMSVAEHISAMSNGHVKYYDSLSGTPMDVYNSNYHISGSVDGSQYIRLQSTDLINILIGYNENLSFNNAEFYIYFYDANGNIVWDVFDYTNPVTGEKNRITASNLKAINGFQFKEVPEGYYIRIAMANDCNLKLAIWDGKKFGIPLSASAGVYNSSYQKVTLPEDGSSCIALPTYGSYIIAKPGYTFLRGMTSAGSSSSYKDPIPEAFFPAQVIRLTDIDGAERPKNIVIVKDYNYTDGTYSKDVLAGDVSDYVSVLDTENTFCMEKPVGVAHRVILNKAEALTRKFAWTPVANVVNSGGTTTFKAGCTYHGVPYRSAWTIPACVGWHVTKHTFINASLDPDSIFYHNPSPDKPGPYYSLVCSSFATLVAGFDYPMTNFGLMEDPNTSWIKIKQPMVGGLLTNGYGHCLIPIERYNSAENDHFALKIVEGISSYSRARVVFDGVIPSWGGIGLDSNYMDKYTVMCYPNKYDYNYSTPYDIEKSSFRTDTTAKPYHGDRCVYTSQSNVRINIKDPTANRLYYQKFDASVSSSGVLLSATPTGEPAYITFEPGTTQVILRSKNGDGGTYTGANLEDNQIYGIWASLDDAQATAPTVVESGNTVYVVEYFEWHDNTLNPITYTVENGILKTDNEFWYCIAAGYNYADPYYPGDTSGKVSIPYEAPRKSMNGSSTAEHSDYSKYGERFYIKSANDVRAFFRKGRFGAYTVEFNVDQPEPDDTPDDTTDDTTD